MSKIIVETTGSFALLDFNSGDEIQHDRPSVVTNTQFVNMRMGMGQVKALSNELSDDATDAEFKKYLKDSESVELAIAAFVEKYEPKAEEEKQEEAPKKAAKKEGK